MCAPCKIIINEENRGAAGMANALTAIARGEVAFGGAPSPEDEALYRLARIEVEHILGVRREAMAMARAGKVPDRWMKLMHQLYGAT